MRTFLGVLVLGVLLGVGCTPEQQESAGKKLNTAGQVVQQVKTVGDSTGLTSLLPGSSQALAGLSVLLTAVGGYFAKKAVSRKSKNKILRKNMTKTQRVAADKEIYGKDFKASLSK